MRLSSKTEQMLHVYFVAKKKKKSVFLFYIYNFYFEDLIYKWIKQFENQQENGPIFFGNVYTQQIVANNKNRSKNRIKIKID